MTADAAPAPQTYVERLFGLHGRTAVVTGASSGIGAAVARALAAAGARVVATGRDAERLADIVGAIRDAGGSASAVVATIGGREDVPGLASALGEPYGPPDVLVTAAAVNDRPDLADVDWDVWDRTMLVNLEVPFALGQAFGPRMVERRWGRVVHFASQQSSRAYGRSGAYGVSKGAVASLVRSQAEAWSPWGVTVNAIAPGVVQTPMTASLFADPDLTARMADRTLIKRNGVIDDHVGAAVFLASDASAYVTGQILHVDGGFSAH